MISERPEVLRNVRRERKPKVFWIRERDPFYDVADSRSFITSPLPDSFKCYQKAENFLGWQGRRHLQPL